MKTPLFTGVCTAIVTPFDKNGLNLPEFDRLLDMQLDAHVAAIAVCGTTGEASTLTDEEKLLLISHAVTYAKGRCKIIAGIGSNDTKHTVHLAKLAQAYGADGLLAVTPYYNKTSQAGLVQHYAALAQAVDLPIIVYNVPSRTGLDISFATYQKLAEIPNVNGVKEASSNLPMLSKLYGACAQTLNIWTGNDDQIVAAMALGAKGVISTMANVDPTAVVRMVNACLTGDYPAAARMQSDAMPLIDLLFSHVNPLPVKYALEQMGYAVGPCRMPLYLEEEQLTDLRSALLPLLPKQP